MSASLRTLQRAAQELGPLSRGFKSSAASHGGEYAWMHAKQFDIPNAVLLWTYCSLLLSLFNKHCDGVCRASPFALQEKNRFLKYGVGTAVLVVTGFGIPIFAAWWQIKKASGA